MDPSISYTYRTCWTGRGARPVIVMTARNISMTRTDTITALKRYCNTCKSIPQLVVVECTRRTFVDLGIHTVQLPQYRINEVVDEYDITTFFFDRNVCYRHDISTNTMKKNYGMRFRRKHSLASYPNMPKSF